MLCIGQYAPKSSRSWSRRHASTGDYTSGVVSSVSSLCTARNAGITVLCTKSSLARIHRWTPIDSVRTAKGGEGVTGAMIRARIRVDGRLEGDLQALWEGADGGLQWLWRARWRDRTRQEALADWAGASWRARWVGWGSVAEGRRQAGSGMARSRARARLNCSSHGQRLGRCRVIRACRAGEPSGQGEEAPPEGLGGHDPLTQADAGGPAGQVVGHHLYRQPGAVGGEAARGRWFSPTPYLRSRIAFSISAWRRWSASSSRVSPSRSVMKP